MTDEELSKCLEVEAERDIARQEIELLRALLREADRLLSLQGVVFDPAPLQAQIAEALSQQKRLTE